MNDRKERVPSAKATLALLQILILETSSDKPMSLRALLDRLTELGAGIERKTAYRNIQAMQDSGLDVRYSIGRNGGYWYAGGWLASGAQLNSWWENVRGQWALGNINAKAAAALLGVSEKEFADLVAQEDRARIGQWTRDKAGRG